MLAFTVVQLCLYSAVLTWACYDVYKVKIHKDNMLSLFTAFLGCVVLVCLLRLLFWSVWCFTSWDPPHSLAIAVFELPIVIQFFTFSLLVLYAKRVVDKSETMWNRRRRLVTWCVFYGLNSVILFITVGFVVAAGCIQQPNQELQHALNRGFDTLVATMFMLLCFAFAFYGYKLLSLPSRSAKGQGPEESMQKTGALCVLLFSIFLTRSLYNMVLSIALPNIADNDIYDEKGTPRGHIQLSYLLMWISWEIVPFMIQLVLFNPQARSTSSLLHHRYYSFLLSNTSTETSSGHSPPTQSVLSAGSMAEHFNAKFADSTLSTGSGRFFQDDNRYDSALWDAPLGTRLSTYEEEKAVPAQLFPVSSQVQAQINAVAVGYLAAQGINPMDRALQHDTLAIDHTMSNAVQET